MLFIRHTCFIITVKRLLKCRKCRGKSLFASNSRWRCLLGKGLFYDILCCGYTFTSKVNYCSFKLDLENDRTEHLCHNQSAQCKNLPTHKRPMAVSWGVWRSPHIIPMNYSVFWLNAPARLIGGDVYLRNIHKGSVNLREGLIEKHFNQSIMVEPKMRIYTVSGTF